MHTFYKESKQLLGLGRCPSNDFDAQIADTTITMIQYILLTCRFRYENYQSKAGTLIQKKEEATLQRINQQLRGMFLEIVKVIAVIFEEFNEFELLEKIMHDQQVYEKVKRLWGDNEKVNVAA